MCARVFKTLRTEAARRFFGPGIPKPGTIGCQDRRQLTASVAGHGLRDSAGIARPRSIDQKRGAVLTLPQVQRYSVEARLRDIMLAENEIVATDLLQLVAERGILGKLAFKVSTCLRKMFIGSRGGASRPFWMSRGSKNTTTKM